MYLTWIHIRFLSNKGDCRSAVGYQHYSSTMDDVTAAFMLMQEAEECDADTFNEEFNTHLTAAIFITGANVGQLLHKERGEIEAEACSFQFRKWKKKMW